MERQCEHTYKDTLKMKSDHCARGWKFFSGKCYYFSTDEETWTASQDACVAAGGHLVIVSSSGEQNFLKRSKPGSGREFYWIGLTDAVVEGEWRWLDGTKLSQTSRFWAGTEPDDWKGAQNAHPEGEDCAVMELSSASYGSQDAFCNKDNRKHKRVCEAKAGM
ncbi:C-type lectin domain family 4 member E-like [Electrophorus electricus]|uniref:C-type lectin domain family 4 member E-like n=1 Tax=Electrophorus electricus TaxID=8005 RepID=UPI0015D00AFA|nr:C-type lectin domain family 4 member E-like [Electrophorus electricus]